MGIVIQPELGAEGCQGMASELRPDLSGYLERAQVSYIRNLNTIVSEKAGQNTNVEPGVVGYNEILIDEVLYLRSDVGKIRGIHHVP